MHPSLWTPLCKKFPLTHRFTSAFSLTSHTKGFAVSLGRPRPIKHHFRQWLEVLVTDQAATWCSGVTGLMWLLHTDPGGNPNYRVAEPKNWTHSAAKRGKSISWKRVQACSSLISHRTLPASFSPCFISHFHWWQNNLPRNQLAFQLDISAPSPLLSHV